MKEKLRFLGMDVHAETIAAAIAAPDGEVRSLGTLTNRMDSVRNRDLMPLRFRLRATRVFRTDPR
jgi:hypothetical protein